MIDFSFVYVEADASTGQPALVPYGPITPPVNVVIFVVAPISASWSSFVSAVSRGRSFNINCTYLYAIAPADAYSGLYTRLCATIAQTVYVVDEEENVEDSEDVAVDFGLSFAHASDTIATSSMSVVQYGPALPPTETAPIVIFVEAPNSESWSAFVCDVSRDTVFTFMINCTYLFAVSPADAHSMASTRLHATVEELPEATDEETATVAAPQAAIREDMLLSQVGQR